MYLRFRIWEQFGSPFSEGSHPISRSKLGTSKRCRQLAAKKPQNLAGNVGTHVVSQAFQNAKKEEGSQRNPYWTSPH